MKNLKKILSMALATVMVMSLMIVGAGAASFSDPETIENTEAVEVVSALGIIGGYPDGTFRGEQNVTRAEMVKMICVALNGGTDPVIGVKDTPTYTDVRNSADAWAESYIDYCSNLGIVSGVGGGRFNPSRNVTGSEAAKMLLVAMGYDSDIFGFTGADWATNVAIQANNADLYEGVSSAVATRALTRDEAAQMIYNGIMADMMQRSPSMTITNGEITWEYRTTPGQTIFTEKFGGKVFIGTYTGNADTNTAATEGQVVVNGKLETDDANTALRNAYFPSDLDISNIGEEVKVLFKDNNGGTANQPDRRDTIYGAYNTGSTQVVTATKNDIKDQKSSDAQINIGGTKYNTTNSVTVVTNYVGTGTSYLANNGNTSTNSALTAQLKAQSVDTIKFVFDEDGKIFSAYVTEYGVGRVNAVTSTRVTISGVGTIDIDGNNIYSGIAQDDVVVYTKFYDTDKDDAYFTVTRAEIVEGELTGYKEDNGAYTNVVVNGTTYLMNGKPAVNNIPELSDDAVTTLAASNIGDTVRLYMVNGMVAAIRSIEATGGNYALITDVSTTGTIGSDLNAVRVALLLADGTKQTVIVHKDSTYDGTNKITGTIGGTVEPVDTYLKEGTLIEYSSISSNNEVKIRGVAYAGGYTDPSSSTTKLANIGTLTGGTGSYLWNKTTKALTYNGTSSAVAASNAVLFVKVGNDNYAYMMRDLGNITVDAFSGAKSVAYYMNNGQVVAAYVTLSARPSSSSADALYGIVTGYTGTRSIDNTTHQMYTVAVGRDEDVTIYVESATKDLSAGDLIYFDETSDGRYASSDVNKIVTGNETTAAGFYLGAARQYNASSNLLTVYSGTSRTSATEAFTGTGLGSYTVDDDVKIINVNADNNSAGDEVGVVAFNADTGYANVIFHLNTEGVVDVIIVETSGEANLAAYGSNKDVATTNFGVKSGALTITSTVSGTNASNYVATNNIATEAGLSFTVSVTCNAIASGTSERVAVTYNGTTVNLTFSATGTQSATFTAAAGQSTVNVVVS